MCARESLGLDAPFYGGRATATVFFQKMYHFDRCVSIDTDRAFWGVVVAAVEPIGVCGAARHLQLRATWTSKRPCTRRVVRLKRVQ